ncbi:phage tail protein, partial [Pseudomonas sp. Env-2]
YGITDVYTKDEAGQGFASRAVTLAGYNIGDAYTKDQVDARLSNKADKASTLAGYGIADAYTKTEAGQSFASRAVTLAGYNIGDAYTKTQIDGSLSGKADKATTLAGYGITDAYTRTQADQRLDGKAPNVAASESVAGISSVSTQNQTNAGLDDATFVTPKKLRAGFLSSFTLNGFIAFPTWLGGLIIQWGRTASLGDGNSTTVSLPLTFPATTLQMWTSIYGDVSGDSTACRVSAGQFLSLSQIKVSYNETTSALGGAAVTWICVGF